MYSSPMSPNHVLVFHYLLCADWRPLGGRYPNPGHGGELHGPATYTPTTLPPPL